MLSTDSPLDAAGLLCAGLQTRTEASRGSLAVPKLCEEAVEEASPVLAD